MNERRSNTICAVVVRPYHHCGDDPVVDFTCGKLTTTATATLTRGTRVEWTGEFVCRHRLRDPDTFAVIISRAVVQYALNVGGRHRLLTDEASVNT